MPYNLTYDNFKCEMCGKNVPSYYRIKDGKSVKWVCWRDFLNVTKVDENEIYVSKDTKRNTSSHV